MKINVKSSSLEKVKGALLVVATPETKGRLPDSLKKLDKAHQGVIGRMVRAGGFEGSAGQSVMGFPATGPKQILLVGVGKSTDISPRSIRRAAAVGARKALDADITKLSLSVPAEASGDLTPEVVGQSAAEGVCEGGWVFDELQENQGSNIEAATLIAADSAQKKRLEAGCAAGHAIGEGQCFARRLQALPGNICTPSFLGDTAKTLGREHGIKVTVYDEAAIKRMRMGALLSVSSGSVEPPRFIVLEYKGGKGPPIGLVGKGVTFDTGGISLKPPQKMEEMKFDMSGAAAVFGAFEALGRIRPACNVVGIVPSVENMPSGSSVKPGDIVKSHSGKTIEVINTDAEGRLILCDALSFMKKFKPSCVLDAATLTGAVVIALGHDATGLMGNDEQLLAEVQAAGERADERCWPLPMWDEYRKTLESDYADIKNLGDRAASSIAAGWFLREFVDGYSWAHLDIAGTAYGSEKPHLAAGPTGVGVRLFTQFILGRDN